MDRIDFYNTVKHSPIYNYAGIPGLTSWLIHDFGSKGVLRLFECERDHQEVIVPHSHRYDFVCEVLRGAVMNTLWEPSVGHGDKFMNTTFSYDGDTGKYRDLGGEEALYTYTDKWYYAGAIYAMDAHEIHSIKFTKGTIVLFHQGPDIDDCNEVLEPVVNGKKIPTFKIEPWMFDKG